MRAPGPVVWAQRGAEARLDELAATRTDRGVVVATPDGRVAIDLAEHLLAALGGLGVFEGVRIETDDDELPLLDGGARLFCEALFSIGAPCGGPRPMWLVAPATLSHGASTYRFTPTESGEPKDASASGVRISVEVSFPPPVGRERAEWSGDPADFFARIAPARTFGWAHELEALRASARARGTVDLKSVIVFDGDGVMPGCRPSAPGEIARHKLLDLIGDLALYGGPPAGVIEAFAPGHTATHAVVAEGRRSGVFARSVVGGDLARESLKDAGSGAAS